MTMVDLTSPGPRIAGRKHGAWAAEARELLRLAIPRRVYTQSHIDYLVEAILEVNARKESLRGLRMTYQPPFLRHFTARFEPL